MKIVTYAGSVIWNENHPALKKYGDDCLAFRHGSAAELIARIGEDRDVLVLTDNDPASFDLYDTLTDVFHSRRIHLFVCLPFTYESSRRKREILARLKDLEMARSLCLVKLDDFLAGSGTDETLGSLQLRIRNDMIVLLEQAIAAMKGMDEFSQFRFDFETGGYRAADLSNVQNELIGSYAEKRQAEERTAAAENTVPSETEAEKETAAAERESGPAETETMPEETLCNTEKKEIQDKGTDTPEVRKRRSLLSFLHRKKG